MGPGRSRAALRALPCLLLAGTPILAPATSTGPDRLAVVVPAHAGDLPRAVTALDQWPKDCSPVTQENVDLILYYAEGEEDSSAAKALDVIESSAGKCFANTRLIYANLNEEDDVYPRGPSVQFYKIFLDEDVKAQFEDYDAFAIIEWDVLVASDRSFARLYDAAFKNSEDFWVKGSNIEGTNFHGIAESSEMWHVMGHINGNAIYNNNDPAFAEYVQYTLARWQYNYPYDVALWATISDFPYSWPLWQHYSSKFVTTNLISNVGYEHVDSNTVSEAVAGETLFIHGSSVDAGNLSVLKAATPTDAQDASNQLRCEATCGNDDGSSTTGASPPVGTSTFCDPTCAAPNSRFGGYLCGAGDPDTFGDDCRTCYTDVEEARKVESALAEGVHVVMCDTQRPPAALDCDEQCALRKDTVCDDTCGTGVHGDYNCNWRGLGPKCRFCFEDIETALDADEVAKRHGGRVIMCDTHEPPVAVSVFDDEALVSPALRRRLTHEEPKWKRQQKWKKGKYMDSDDDEEEEVPKWKKSQKWKKGKGGGSDPDSDDQDVPKWKKNQKWKKGKGGGSDPDSDDDEDDVPKWKKNQKWKKGKDRDYDSDSSDDADVPRSPPPTSTCLDGCERTSKDGTKGRVCDPSCRTGNPYGQLGCNAKRGRYGRDCRTCYNDMELAMVADRGDQRAIMCDTRMPATMYDRRRLSGSSRRLSGDVDEPKWKRQQKWKKGKGGGSDPDSDDEEEDVPKWKKSQKWKKGKGGGSDPDSDDEDDVPKWKKNQKWKKSKGGGSDPDSDDDEDDVPKWKKNQKWKKSKGGGSDPDSDDDEDDVPRSPPPTSTCLDGCERTSKDGTKGRVCDPSCRTGNPYGQLGCNAKRGRYGRDCRTCYNDMELAMVADRGDQRAIMCDTRMPATMYDRRRLSGSSRRLSGDVDEPKWKRQQKWKKGKGGGSEPDSDDEDDVPKWKKNQKWKKGKGGGSDPDSDDEDDVPKWKKNQKWKKSKGGGSDPDSDDEDDVPKWKKNQKWKKDKDRGYDSDSSDDADVPRSPPPTSTCLDGCERTSKDGTKGRVCDPSCRTGNPYGQLGCNAKRGRYGRDCRTCYNDMELAMVADRGDQRAIMCDTRMPATMYDRRRLSGSSRRLSGDVDEPKWKRQQKWKKGKGGGSDPDSDDEDDVPKWKKNQKWKKGKGGGSDPDSDDEDDVPKWKKNQKWKKSKGGGSDPDSDDEDDVPKWKKNQKWKKGKDRDYDSDSSDDADVPRSPPPTSTCLDGCERTSKDGTKGRVCDPSCRTGNPYGQLGCNAKRGRYGRDCRTCYNDMELAMVADRGDQRAIMCDTRMPATLYDRRRLSLSEPFHAEEEEEGGEEGYDAESVVQRMALEDFNENVKRGEICAFIEGGANRLLQTDVTVQSILEFMPGLRVAVTTEPDTLDEYESTVGQYPSVAVSSTPDVRFSSLFADKRCGEGTKLILYMQAGSVLSREFSSKDTHTPRGELLVVYGDARHSYLDAEIARDTAAVLGFDAPSFTYGTDLILPVGANSELRTRLAIGEDGEAGDLPNKFDDRTSIPQLLAALAYSQDPEGVHFVNPQTWVTENLFKHTSIWEIPLMKPRFACAIPNPTALPPDDEARAQVLERSLEFFLMGGACENGLVAVEEAN